MNNYKIKVNGEAESKEAQELFESLGYEKGACSLGNYPAVIVTTQDWVTGSYCSTRALGLDIPAHENYKEITLAELRDMVVLKRNDVNDATHINNVTDSKVLQQGNKNYYWYSGEWHLYPCGVDIRPIEKPIINPLKEYLVPQGNGKYALTKATEKRVSDWIEIPDGKNVAYIHSHKKYVYFLAKPLSFTNHQCVWQRPTQPEEPSLEIGEIESNITNSLSRHSIGLDDEPFHTPESVLGGVDATLAERQSQYGCYEDVAQVTQQILSALRIGNYDKLPAPMKESLHMIASKMARIVNGDPEYFDNWHDIGGYAKLIEKLIKGE